MVKSGSSSSLSELKNLLLFRDPTVVLVFVLVFLLLFELVLITLLLDDALERDRPRGRLVVGTPLED